MALSADRKTVRKAGDDIVLPSAASVVSYYGAMVAMDTSGNARPARTSTTDTVIGVNFDAKVDNSSGSAGDKSITITKNVIAKFKNSATTDEIANTEIGATCYVVDDETVAKTDGSSSRVAAGTVHFVDADGGVFVKFA